MVKIYASTYVSMYRAIHYQSLHQTVACSVSKRDSTKDSKCYLDKFPRVMPRIRKRQRAAATTMLLNGSSQPAVAAHFGVHRSTISRLYERLRTNGITDDRSRSGRPRVTSRRQDRYIGLCLFRSKLLLSAYTFIGLLTKECEIQMMI